MKYEYKFDKALSIFAKDIERIEQYYNGCYVGDFGMIKIDDDNKVTDLETIAAVFYRSTVDNPDHSNYFAIFYHPFKKIVAICDGLPLVDRKFVGLRVNSTNQVLISCHRHHCNFDSTNAFAIDGGFDYIRVIGDSTLTSLVDVTVDNGIVYVDDRQ